ncbi:hypothetical protein SLA2020_023860 [Shorea laevis]
MNSNNRNLLASNFCRELHYSNSTGECPDSYNHKIQVFERQMADRKEDLQNSEMNSNNKNLDSTFSHLSSLNASRKVIRGLLQLEVSL